MVSLLGLELGPDGVQRWNRTGPFRCRGHARDPSGERQWSDLKQSLLTASGVPRSFRPPTSTRRGNSRLPTIDDPSFEQTRVLPPADGRSDEPQARANVQYPWTPFRELAGTGIPSNQIGRRALPQKFHRFPRPVVNVARPADRVDVPRHGYRVSTCAGQRRVRWLRRGFATPNEFDITEPLPMENVVPSPVTNNTPAPPA